MSVPWWAWGAVLAVILVMLAVDLFAHRKAHVVGVREAGAWSIFWVTLGLTFGGVIWWFYGPSLAGEYYAGYLIEKSLSVDNVFVFALLFTYFAVPREYQHRVLFYGVLGALVFRAIFIAAGSVIVSQFSWVLYLFGAFLLYTAYKMVKDSGVEVHPDKNPVLRAVRRVVPVTDGWHGQRFWTKIDGRWMATPLFVVLIAVETTDIIFAVDSIPAIFAVTQEPFLIFTSNAFAILGLRALFFLLADAMHRFTLLNYGLAVVLGFVGVKMLIVEFYKVPIWLSLSVIVLAIGASVVLSLRRPATPPETVPAIPSDTDPDTDQHPAPVTASGTPAADTGAGSTADTDGTAASESERTSTPSAR